MNFSLHTIVQNQGRALRFQNLRHQLLSNLKKAPKQDEP